METSLNLEEEFKNAFQELSKMTNEDESIRATFNVFNYVDRMRRIKREIQKKLMEEKLIIQDENPKRIYHPAFKEICMNLYSAIIASGAQGDYGGEYTNAAQLYDIIKDL